ncbi:uncharacterized protein N7511_001414 [Penicillium nucicola]|uniref:uncharacterized protein n=1 Tax=Penicillium nucicola TaxID=1850975 RepID=UPI002545918E|nr:uncharacterized protein N7511_001414 [Penicillium nucicola]KAJ5776403.1 hypothetical protein N7511_001414 [Penicillium nucicola]
MVSVVVPFPCCYVSRILVGNGIFSLALSYRHTSRAITPLESSVSGVLGPFGKYCHTPRLVKTVKLYRDENGFCLVVTSPRIGEKIDPDRPLTIKWQSVLTDPPTFSIELVNQNVYPPTTEVVAQDVDSSKGSYTVKAKSFTDVDVGKGYQINFLSDSNGILAQSQQFGLTAPGALSSSSSGKESSTASETSSGSTSMLSSTASTSEITSSTSVSSTASSISSTTYSPTSASTPTSSNISSTAVSTPATSSMMSSTPSGLTSSFSSFFHSIFYTNTVCCHNAYDFYVFASLFISIYTYHLFHKFIHVYIFTYNNIIYDSNYFFHQIIFHLINLCISFFLDIYSEHKLFYFISFHSIFHIPCPLKHYPWLVMQAALAVKIKLHFHRHIAILGLTYSIESSSTMSSSTMSKTHTSTSTTTHHTTSTKTSTATESATTTSNAAAILLPPAQAGGLLLGLFALAL